MARKSSTTRKTVKATVKAPATFVGTVYDHKTKCYVATRKDGSLTIGRFNEAGSNIPIERPHA